MILVFPIIIDIFHMLSDLLKDYSNFDIGNLFLQFQYHRLFLLLLDELQYCYQLDELVVLRNSLLQFCEYIFILHHLVHKWLFSDSIHR